MSTTTNFGWTYPDSTSNTQLWTHFGTLAAGIDDSLFLYRARGIMTVPTATSSDGTATSGTTDTRDAVLGNYVFTAVASRRYRVVYSGMLLNGSVANDRVVMNIRNGGASTPTGASSSIAASSQLVPATGTNGRQGFSVSYTFTPSAGTVTLGVFLARTAGSGIATPVGTRELYVEDIGPAS